MLLSKKPYCFRAIFALLLVFTPFVHYSQFVGGDADGHADATIISTTCTASGPNPFAGGNADGHADATIISTTCTASGPNPFAGGNADGHADATIISTTCTASGPNLFAGGNADGHADATIMSSTCTASGPNPFGGGNADGHAELRIEVIDPLNCAALPIELLFFRVSCNNGLVQLLWATASETNNDYFTVEQSTDGYLFHPVGTIKATGNSSQLVHYAYTISNPVEETSYFRLKQTDVDGQYEYTASSYSEPCKESFTTHLTVFPNPTTGKFNIQYSGVKEDVHAIEIYNVLGEKVYATNRFQAEFDLSDRGNGVYYVHLISSTGVVTKSIVHSR